MRTAEDLLRQVVPIDDNGFVEQPECAFVPILILRNELAVLFQDTDGQVFKLTAVKWDGMDGEEETRMAASEA